MLVFFLWFKSFFEYPYLRPPHLEECEQSGRRWAPRRNASGWPWGDGGRGPWPPPPFCCCCRRQRRHRHYQKYEVKSCKLYINKYTYANTYKVPGADPAKFKGGQWELFPLQTLQRHYINYYYTGILSTSVHCALINIAKYRTIHFFL